MDEPPKSTLMVLLDAVGGKDHMSKHGGTGWNFC
jgi:hypothetical protein